MKQRLFSFLLALLFVGIMPAMVYAQANGGVHTITRGGSKAKPKPKPKPTPTPKPKPNNNNGGSGTSNRDRILNNLVANMVYIQGGTFTMGATSEQGSDVGDNEKPAHQVTLSSFSIGKYEVTQEEWEAVMGSNPSEFKGAKHPVEQVSWEDCQTFIRKLNQLTGRNFRLPTEAEWEYAARGGRSSRGYKYAGTTSYLDGYAWYTENSGNTTHPVGQKNANELGLYDMSGNVNEWCADWYGDNTSSAQTNPQGPSSGSDRVFRGGSWYGTAEGCRVSIRGFIIPSYGNRVFGLRLAL